MIFRRHIPHNHKREKVWFIVRDLHRRLRPEHTGCRCIHFVRYSHLHSGFRPEWQHCTLHLLSMDRGQAGDHVIPHAQALKVGDRHPARFLRLILPASAAAVAAFILPGSSGLCPLRQFSLRAERHIKRQGVVCLAHSALFASPQSARLAVRQILTNGISHPNEPSDSSVVIAIYRDLHRDHILRAVTTAQLRRSFFLVFHVHAIPSFHR